LKKLLITGSSGFIGSRLLKRVFNAGFDINLLQRTPNSKFETFFYDFNDLPMPSNAFEGVEVVIHLAGIAHDIDNKIDNFDQYRKINIEATKNLIEASESAGVKKFIFLSSVKAGGSDLNGNCLSESNPMEPHGLYAISKYRAEQTIIDYSKKSNIDVIILRSALVYGKDAKGNLKLMYKAIKKRYFPPIPDIRNKKSMVHVDDLIDAILFAISLKLKGYEIFNVTDSNVYSTYEIYLTMIKALNRKPYRWHVPKSIFYILSRVNKNFNNKYLKLFGNECYSSNKIRSYGYSSKRTFNEFDK